jgi:transposase
LEYRAHPSPRGGPTVRDRLAVTFNVSPFTIDNWLRQARDAGALDENRRGRPARPTEGNSK